MDIVTMGESRVAFVPVIRGLVTEADRVRQAVDEAKPEAVALSVGREELEALRAYDGAEAEPSNWEEEMYVVGLGQWGVVRKPPPCFLEAVRVATDQNLAVRALDLNDEDYTDAFTSNISTLDLLWHTRLEKKARDHPFTATTAEEFVLEFDALVTDPDGYARLELARERHMASRIAKLAGKHRALLALVEYERAPGVRTLLDGLGAARR